MDDWKYAILAVGIFFIIAAMFSLGRSRTKSASSRDSARDHVDRARQKQGVRDELEALMVDINRMAKDLGAQLDAKIIRIEKANREAEQRIAQLEALRETLANPSELTPRDPQHDPRAVSDPQSPGSAHDSTNQPRPADAGDRETLLKARVYDLADQGQGPQAIAQQLDEHIGKIELILALRSA